MLTGALNIAVFAAFQFCVWPVLLSNAEFKRVCRNCRSREGGKNGKDRGKNGKDRGKNGKGDGKNGKGDGKNGKGGKVCGNESTLQLPSL